jgi:hypothetical protein
MTFAGVNYLAIVTAAAVAWVAGAAWYMSLSKVWMAAQGLTPEKVHENRVSRAPRCRSSVPSWRSWSWPGCWPG